MLRNLMWLLFYILATAIELGWIVALVAALVMWIIGHALAGFTAMLGLAWLVARIITVAGDPDLKRS